MPSVTFVGLGLNDEKGISLEGLEEAKNADVIFAEFYTNPMKQLNPKRLESLLGKKIQVLDRSDLEEKAGRKIIEAAREKSVVLLVPGDPMIATTHVALRIALAKLGTTSRIVHAASVMSAVCGATGLQSYKFGKAITVPHEGSLPQSVLDTISDNSSRGLHTLLLLDVKPERGDQLTIPEAITKITLANPEMKDTLAIGAARIGAKDEKVKAGKFGTLVREDFGDPPHSIVVVGRLHFMEAEALKVFDDAKDADLGGKA